MSYYKLIDGIEKGKTVKVKMTCGKEIVTKYINVFPDTRYDLPDDDAFIESLENIVVTESYCDDLIQRLETAGIDYEIEYCKGCGGRIRQVTYRLIEVVKDQ